MLPLVLTARQAAAAWPGRAEVIHGHGCDTGEDLADPETPEVAGPVLTRELLTVSPQPNGIAEGQLPASDY